MRFLKQILDFYINSSIHVSLAVLSLSWITLIEFDISYDNNVLYFIFYASITGYNFVKYFGIAKWHHRSLANWLKVIQIFSLICFILFCYYALQFQTKTLLYIVGFGVITFLYAMPFLPKKWYVDSNQNLRNISGLKVYVIALVWTGVTVFLPLVNNNYNITLDVVIVALQRFAFVIVLTLPFEIRDLQYDSIKLSTIPQQIGIKKTKAIGLLLLLWFFFSEFLKEYTNLERVIILIIITCITLLFLVFSHENRTKYYSSFWVEGLPILWLLLLLF